ncbi:hypothetical protein PT974_00385 [Cladobotryum mycophilum]|uniref:Ribosome assembly protein 3 n=1 Tax=Cladobotryum mycophilum TaxID=491253 RepID=A0ABR0T1Y6_9HYPO
MPPRTRKRKSSETSNEPDHDATPIPKKTARAAPKTTRNTRAKAESGFDKWKDEIKGGRNSLKSGSSSRNIRTSAPEAKQHIRKQGDELAKLIEGNTQQTSAIGGSRTPGMDDLFSKIAEALPDTISSKHPKDYMPRNSIYQKAHDCISSFQRMIDEYETLNKGNHGINRPTGLRWEQDSKDLTELNQKALAISIRTLNGNILAGTHGSALAPPTNTEDDIEKVAWEMLVDGRPKTGEETWGAAAQDLMRVFSGAAKLLTSSNKP